MKKIAILLFFISIVSHAQKEKSEKLGQVTLEELQMEFYKPDSTATAVMLKEHANYYFNEKKYYERITDFYFKKKIFNKNDSENLEVNLTYSGKRDISGVKCFTYNLSSDNKIVKTEINPTQIFKTDVDKDSKKISFSFPNVKNGSVIEYVFTIKSEYTNIQDWFFQSNIPKLKSDFTGLIFVGNTQYNITLKGDLELDRKDYYIKEDCYSRLGRKSECMVVNYGIDNVPAYKEESYTTSPLNYISRVVFDSHRNPGINSKKYREMMWTMIDVSFKRGFSKFIKSKEKFFKRKLPVSIQEEKDDLIRAKKTYNYIQNHFVSNADNSNGLNINRTFKNKSGNNFSINLTLLASLNAVNIKSYFVFVSTRGNGFPSRLNPSINDFNYTLLKTVINDKEYFIDATDKDLVFGMTPYETLSGEVRVMNIDESSYWQKIEPGLLTSENVNLSVNVLNKDDIKGAIEIVSKGYKSLALKKLYKTVGEEKYIEDLEDENEIEIINYNIKGIDSTVNELKQKFEINYENQELSNNDNIYINPFLYTGFKVNPFTLEERTYPVDFGFKQDYSFRAKISFPTDYIIREIPKSAVISLQNNGGRILFNIKKNESSLIVFFKLKLNKSIYSSNEYFALKEFFNQIVKLQSTIITLEKEQ